MCIDSEYWLSVSLIANNQYRLWKIKPTQSDENKHYLQVTHEYNTTYNPVWWSPHYSALSVLFLYVDTWRIHSCHAVFPHWYLSTSSSGCGDIRKEVLLPAFEVHQRSHVKDSRHWFLPEIRVNFVSFPLVKERKSLDLSLWLSCSGIKTKWK